MTPTITLYGVWELARVGLAVARTAYRPQFVNVYMEIIIDLPFRHTTTYQHTPVSGWSPAMCMSPALVPPRARAVVVPASSSAGGRGERLPKGLRRSTCAV